MSMAFIDLQAQRHRIADKVNEAVLNVVSSGQYILGPQLKAFETALAEFSKAKFALGCANGTDALVRWALVQEMRFSVRHLPLQRQQNRPYWWGLSLFLSISIRIPTT